MKLTFRIWLLIFAWAIAILMIGINFEKGVLIKSIEKNSSAALSGLSAGEIIKSINSQRIENIKDYSEIASTISAEEMEFKVQTDKGDFTYKSKTLDFDVFNLTIVNVYDNAEKSGMKQEMIVKEINSNIISSDFDFLTIKNNLEPKTNLEI